MEKLANDFIIFKDTKTRFNEPYISITRANVLHLSKAFMNQIQEKLIYNYLVIYYSKSSNCIALEFTNDTNKKGVMKITVKKNKNSKFLFGTVSIRLFLNTYKNNMNLEEIYNKHFIAKLKDVPNFGKMWVINLNI